MHKLRIAVISDLHCHPKRLKDQGKDETYLLADKLRVPANDHPVESLITDVIKKDEPLTVDLTLCPGDFTDRANVLGFIMGWGFSLEISRELNSQEIIATLGNHDVAVYDEHIQYTLEVARGIKRNFPLSDDIDYDRFWSKGGAFVEKGNYRVLVINSSHFHHNKKEAVSGKVGDELLDYVRTYMRQKNDDKINLAMSHHHPIDHSRLKLGEHDKIVNGNALLDLLGEFKFDLFLHGHKHDPLLRYHPTSSGHQICIFSAGSFAASSNVLFAGARNTFHIIDLTKNGTTKGEIRTWTFLPNQGWRINLDESGFAPYTGFGSLKNVSQIYTEITALFNGVTSLEWSYVSEQIDDVNHLLPADSLALYQMLKDNNFHCDEHLWLKPKRIYKVA